MSLDKLELPENFKAKLIEVVDPTQSLDYFESEITFPVQVLPISLERKLVRLGKQEDKESSVIQACGELAHFYYPFLTLDWASRNLSLDDAQIFFERHLEKQVYNDEIISVVHQVILQIEWHPSDPDDKDQWEKYAISTIFSDTYAYTTISHEHLLPVEFHTKLTRGCSEVMRLNQMITSDRFKSKAPSDKPKPNKKIDKPGSVAEYMEGMAEQGVDIGSLFRN